MLDKYHDVFSLTSTVYFPAYSIALLMKALTPLKARRNAASFRALVELSETLVQTHPVEACTVACVTVANSRHERCCEKDGDLKHGTLIGYAVLFTRELRSIWRNSTHQSC